MSEKKRKRNHPPSPHVAKAAAEAPEPVTAESFCSLLIQSTHEAKPNPGILKDLAAFFIASFNRDSPSGWRLDGQELEDTLRRLTWNKRVRLVLDFVVQCIASLAHTKSPNAGEESLKAKPAEDAPKIKLVFNLNESRVVSSAPAAQPTTAEMDEDDALYNDPSVPQKPSATQGANLMATEEMVPEVLGFLKEALLDVTDLHGGSDTKEVLSADKPIFRAEFDTERFLQTLTLILELGIFEEISSMVDRRTRVELVSIASIAICSTVEGTKSPVAQRVLLFSLYGKLLTQWGLDTNLLSLVEGFYSWSQTGAIDQVELARLNSLCSAVSLGVSLKCPRFLTSISALFSHGEFTAEYPTLATSLTNSLQCISHVVFYENLASMLVPTDFVEPFLQLPVSAQRTLLTGVTSLLGNDERCPFPDDIRPLLVGIVLELLKRQPSHLLPKRPLDLRQHYPLLLPASVVRLCLKAFPPHYSKSFSQLWSTVLETLFSPSSTGPVFSVSFIQELAQKGLTSASPVRVDKFAQFFQVARNGGYIEPGEFSTILSQISPRTRLLDAVLRLFENQMC